MFAPLYGFDKLFSFCNQPIKVLLHNEEAWHRKIKESNTVFFKKPNDDIMKKYYLAPDYDETFGGDLAHVVVMQNVSKKLIDEFIEELCASK